MNITEIGNNIAFGRALTSKESADFQNTVNEAKKQLGTDKTAATVFDFSFPSAENDPGIGTSFSYNAQEMADFLKTQCGVNVIQLQPQGQISNLVRSPYSGTSFSLGAHTIDLNKLATSDYGNILTEEDLNSPYMTRTNNHNEVDYNNIFADDGQKAMLKIAYKRFAEIDENNPLKQEFARFKDENTYWLEKDALFEACAVANGSEDVKDWSERDKNVFATKEGDKKRIQELRQVEDEEGNNVVDFEEFVQFIADKEQKESKANFNNNDIQIWGDCQIGFSDKDVWAHKSAFYPNYEFGCDIGNDQYSCWSPAIDFSKLKGDAGELLKEKFNLFFKRYDGVRIDAAWQLMKPMICEPITENGHEKFDSNGNKLGIKLAHQPNIDNDGKYIIENIILKAADDNNVSRNNVLLELLGGNSYATLDKVKGMGAQLIHITRYGGERWGRVKHYEGKSDNKYQNMRPGEYIIGPGTHDDTTLIEQAATAKDRADYLSKDLYLSKTELEKSPKQLSKAVFAELFTTKNQFFTLPDILGSSKRINTPNTIDGNWIYRAPVNYEEEYHKNLVEGKGLNLPDALSKALKSKNNGNSTELTSRLDYYAGILEEDGPMTTKEADKLYLNG